MEGLFKHQQKILDLNPPRHLLSWSTGSGKTKAALALAEKNCFTFMIICPKGLKENWRREVMRWLGFRVDVFNVKVPVYTNILIISKEEFRKFSEVLPKYDGVIVDEAHTFAGIKSQLRKSLEKYLKRHSVKYRWFLTATPFLRNAWNVFVLGKLLGEDWNYAAFRARFFYERFLGQRTFWDARPGMEQDVAKLVHMIGSTVKLEDCVDMPEAVFETERFPLTSEQKAAMKKVVVVLPIVRFTKYHQICGGTLKGNEYEDTQFIKSEKLDRVVELAEANDKLVISCRYIEEMQMIGGHIKDKSVFYLDGSTKDKQAVIDAYNSRPEAVLIVNAMCSEGWSVADAKVKYPTRVIVFYSHDFSLKNKIQMEGRIRRIDLPQPVTYIALVCEESIDEAVVDALERKMDFDAAIYNQKIK